MNKEEYVSKLSEGIENGKLLDEERYHLISDGGSHELGHETREN